MTKDGQEFEKGRPTKFTKENIDIILDGLKSNLTQRLSAHLAGIHEDTYYDWMNKGLNDLKQGIESDFSRFSETILKARAKKAKKLTEAYENEDRYWLAKDALLRKLYREDYGEEGEEVKRLKVMLAQFIEVISKK